MEERVSELIETLKLLLVENPTGISEHQLLKLLQHPPIEFFSMDALRDPLVLFQTHFLLFHCLYTIQQQWAQSNSAQLEISTLNIIIKDYSHTAARNRNQTDIQQADPLAQYYLDWSHFSSTSKEDVDELLNSFWKKVFNPLQDNEIEQALTILELDAPVSTAALKVQYRRLAQQHHPDKGGDSEYFKKICHAFHQLKNHNASVL